MLNRSSSSTVLPLTARELVSFLAGLFGSSQELPTKEVKMKLGYLVLLPALVGTACAYLATTTASILFYESSRLPLTKVKRYYDGQEGACGCGTSSGIDSWQVGL